MKERFMKGGQVISFVMLYLFCLFVFQPFLEISPFVIEWRDERQELIGQFNVY